MDPIALIFIALAVCLILGIPVAFSIGISVLSFLLYQGYPSPIVMAQRMVDGARSYTMMALPMFIFAGALMAYGSTPRLMRLANMLVSKVPGGLGAATLVTCGFFGAVSGSGVASTAAIGGIVGKEMLKQGYGLGITAGILAGGGVMATLIPPSLVMVIYAASTGVSVGDMFVAGIGPGVFIILLLILMNCIIAKRRNIGSGEIITYTAGDRIKIIADALLPLFLPVLIIGGVISGVLTPTESSVIATVYALFLAVFVYKELTFAKFIKATSESVITSAIILFIISSATPFGWLMATQNVPQIFTQSIINITTNPYMIMAIFFCLLWVLGCFMETICIIILITPILFPIVTSMGVDPIHFGVGMMANLAVGGITPPLSVGLFTACRILNCKIEQTFPDVLYIVAVITVGAIITFMVPEFSLFLVDLLK
ncbi:Neu5Ac permease [Anaerobiospirillum thomasii]|uniref:TRAP transporter large permease protein n=2 Tax=Gammaproteobacteria TaxID=1236 RepID=A0A2X0VMG3_9GAMM|nr:TRAP transporter large permease [Anaerobiospirillum thomasii]SPT68930.1 Neu5Ac permease [Anaerobiospirillum thomasii]SPT71166.1 Neu5Ac permease [Anaerobiospirillum thomasii]